MRTRSILAVILSFSLAAPVLPGKTTKPKAVKEKPVDDARLYAQKLNKDEQIRFALERLTFGPRAGDFEAVKKMGLKKWLDQQLHPEKLKENAQLETKLAPLDSLRMTEKEAAQNYPPQQLIAQVARGRAPLPEDPLTRSAVERMVARYKVRNKIEGAAPANRDEDMIEPAVSMEDLLTAQEIKTLRNGKADDRKAILAKFDEEKFEQLAIALPQGMRFGNMPYAPAPLRRMFLKATAPQQILANDLNEGKLFRAAYSTHQLEELLVDFWYNHFNVYLDKGSDRLFVPTYEREAIRPFVFGNFRDLLKATSESPAMLFYLDNWQSVAPPPANRPVAKKGGPARPSRGLNENYGRELLELHTLGVDGGYTQKDIIDVARCFTGWTIREPRIGGGFWYNDRVHDKGEKVVLGVTIPAGGGREDGEKVLDILLKHPSTAKFISRKIAIRFVSDNPPAALVDHMAQTFAATSGDIRSVIRAMLDSKEFWSRGADHAKIKTPFEMVASAIRAIGADIEFGSNLATQLQQLGQPLYRKIEPTGYSAVNAEWVNSAALLGRMNFALALAQNKVAGVKVDPDRFPESADTTRIARQILNRDVSSATRAAIAQALDEQLKKNPKAKPSPALIAGLILGSPDFQRK